MEEKKKLRSHFILYSPILLKVLYILEAHISNVKLNEILIFSTIFYFGKVLYNNIVS